MAFEQIDIPHKFTGFGGISSRCHFRILDEEDKPLVVICSQTNKLEGTSVTNMVEFLAKDVREYIEQNNKSFQEKIKKYLKTSKPEILLGDIIEYLKKNNKFYIFILESLRSYFELRTKYKERKDKIENMVWVELYPKGVLPSFFEDDHYSIVNFNEQSWEPTWSKTTIEKLSKLTKYPQEKFIIKSKHYSE